MYNDINDSQLIKGIKERLHVYKEVEYTTLNEIRNEG